ncbi:unnamed protein product [Parajaminaea phylloscopi]
MADNPQLASHGPGVTAGPAAEAFARPAGDGILLEDDEDPRKWSAMLKWSIVTVISLMGFIAPLGSSIIIPGSHALEKEFHFMSRARSLLPVSLFVLGLGVGPFCLAPASELVGRRPVYLATSVIFILFNIGSALAPSFAGLCVLRFIAGAVGSTGPSLGAGTISDLFAPVERGRAQSLYGLGPLMGPVVGNIIGGWIVQDHPRSWRWLLWTLTIMSAVVALLVCFSFRETYSPVLLQRKRKAFLQAKSQGGRAPAKEESLVARLQKPLTSLLRPSAEAKTKWKQALSRPFRLLFLNPICATFSFYLGFCYGIIFLFLVEHPLLYQRREAHEDPPPDRLPTYGWRPGPASMSYAGLGLGFLIAAMVNAFLQDPIYNRLTASGGRVGLFLFKKPGEIESILTRRDEEKGRPQARTEGSVASPTDSPANVVPTPQIANIGQPEYRLPLCVLGMCVLPTGLFVFGWAAQTRCHWLVPLVGSLLVGAGTILCFQSIIVYLVDAFFPYSASAMACAVLVRSILAAAFPLFAQELFRTLGFGWGSSLLAFIALAGIPAPMVLFRCGPRMRDRYRFSG